jgi:hypothetical protein
MEDPELNPFDLNHEVIMLLIIIGFVFLLLSLVFI